MTSRNTSTYILVLFCTFGLTIVRLANEVQNLNRSASLLIDVPKKMEEQTRTNGSNLDHDESAKCLSVEHEVDEIINSTEQIFIAMLAKASSGSSLKEFIEDCTGLYSVRNFANHPIKTRELITSNLTLPPIIPSHIVTDGPIIDLIEGASDETVLFLTYRREIDRLLSAIQHVVVKRLCSGNYESLEPFVDKVVTTEKSCTIEEEALITIIAEKRIEISYGVHEVFTCEMFEAIEANDPKMVLIDYTQVDSLQSILAKHYCPELLGNPKHAHRLIEGTDILVQLSNKQEERQSVLLDTWLEKKKQLLQWGLGMKNGVPCQAKVRALEKKLHSCDEKMYLLSSGL